MVVELISAERKSGSVVFKVAVLEGNVTESFEASTLFIDVNGKTSPNLLGF